MSKLLKRAHITSMSDLESPRRSLRIQSFFRSEDMTADMSWPSGCSFSRLPSATDGAAAAAPSLPPWLRCLKRKTLLIAAKRFVKAFQFWLQLNHLRRVTSNYLYMTTRLGRQIAQKEFESLGKPISAGRDYAEDECNIPCCTATQTALPSRPPT